MRAVVRGRSRGGHTSPLTPLGPHLPESKAVWAQASGHPGSQTSSRPDADRDCHNERQLQPAQQRKCQVGSVVDVRVPLTLFLCLV